MKSAKHRLRYALLILPICIICISVTPFLIKGLLFQMPVSSPSFDCDDSTLLMYDRFSSMGIKSVAIAGNLKIPGEEFQEIDHVWLLAEIGGRDIAFDWGVPCLDGEHYEGYLVSYEQLLEQVRHDQYTGQLASLR